MSRPCTEAGVLDICPRFHQCRCLPKSQTAIAHPTVLLWVPEMLSSTTAYPTHLPLEGLHQSLSAEAALCLLMATTPLPLWMPDYPQLQMCRVQIAQNSVHTGVQSHKPTVQVIVKSGYGLFK